MDLQSLETQNLLLIALSILVFILVFQNFFLRSRYKRIFRKNKEFSIENVISEHLSRTDRVEKDMEALLKDIVKLQEHSKKMVQKANMKRYNAFSDTGSNQSFTISLLDANNNGLLLTGLHSREGVRLYAKPVADGSSEHQLSNEEAEILREALN